MAQAAAETAEAKSKGQPITLERREWDEVLEFWFPDHPDEDAETHGAHWMWRMRGGADEEIIRRFTDLTNKAAAGELDHWAKDPRGRLALIIALDQFPRSVWRGEPRAFAQDEKRSEEHTSE